MKAAAVIALTVLALTVPAGCGTGTPQPAPSPVASSAVTAALGAAVALQQQGDLTGAQVALAAVLVADPRNVEATYDLGVIAQRQGDTATALMHYAAALAIMPDYVPAMFNSATLDATTDPALAITTYRRITTLEPHSPTAFLNLGLLELQSGQQPAGVADLRTAVQQDTSLRARLTPAQLALL